MIFDDDKLRDNFAYFSVKTYVVGAHKNCLVDEILNSNEHLQHRLLWRIDQNFLSRIVRKPTFWFQTWSNTNRAVQSQQMARGLKIQI